MILFLDEAPTTIVTERFGLSKKPASNSLTISFALPSTGGAVTVTENEFPSRRFTSFLRAPAFTRTDILNDYFSNKSFALTTADFSLLIVRGNASISLS